MLETALKYERMGLGILPIQRNKKPYVAWEKYQKERADVELIKEWWEKYPNANVGIVTGDISGIDVIDIDSQEGMDNIEKLLPDSLITPIAKTPGGGWHYYHRSTKGMGNAVGFVDHCDFRGTGGYIIAAPSVGENEKPYAWLPSLSIFDVAPASLPDGALELIRSASRGTEQVEGVSQHTSSDWLPVAMRGVKKGERNAIGAEIAGYWINKVPQKDVLTILRLWNQNNTPPLSDNDILTIVSSISRYEPKKKLETINIANVYTAKRMLREYDEYIKNLAKNRFITGITEIDKRIRGVAGGEVLTIIARAGSFKTAMLQNLLKNYTQHSSWGAVFFSIEMPISSITERYYEIIGGMSGRDIENIYRNSEANKVKESLEAEFIKGLERLYTVPTRVTVPAIESYVKLIEREFDNKVGLIGIDYLGLVDGDGKSEYEVISKMAKEVKIMAKNLNIPVVLLSQVSRRGGSGEIEISLDMGRGSGVIEEGADFILGLWQVKKNGGEEEDEYDLICGILKNRKGRKGSRWKLDLDAQTLRIGSEAFQYRGSKDKSGIEA